MFLHSVGIIALILHLSIAAADSNECPIKRSFGSNSPTVEPTNAADLKYRGSSNAIDLYWLWLPNGFLDRPEYANKTLLKCNAHLESISKDGFSHGDRLTHFWASGNNLRVIRSRVFEYAPNLEEIDVSNNQIHTIEDFAFAELNNLRQLRLNGNKIGNLSDDAFAGAPNLKEIYLSNNKIVTVDKSLYDLNELTFLDLSQNKIVDLKLNLLFKLPKLTELKMVDSGFNLKSFQCNVRRSSVIILEIADSSQAFDLSDFDSLRCLTGLKYLNLNFKKLEDSYEISQVKQKFPELQTWVSC